jgi:N-carbamoyl-L-amino-acid hydrolase
VKSLGTFLTRAYDIALDYAPWGRITFGELSVHPGSRTTVPESATLSIDMRHPDQATLDQMDQKLRALVTELGSPQVPMDLNEIWHSPAVAFDERCIEMVRGAAANLEYPSMEMVSGAGHDSVYIARVAPCSMIFIPCKDGLSHNEAEAVNEADVSAGCNVLMGAVLALDAAD